MKISPEEVKYVARLAHLDLDNEEVQAMTEKLDSILSYFEKLNELDTTGVPPATHTIDTRNAFRDDVTGVSLNQREALANGPLCNEEAFVVPRVI